MPDRASVPIEHDDDLRRVLGQIQRRGGIGPVDLGDAIEHAERYVRSIPSRVRTVIDLGSGGGLPGLVVAVRRPHVHLELVERRAKRADLLRFGVRALGLGDRVSVFDRDVEDLLAADPPRQVDVVTARSFAPLPTALAVAARVLVPGGRCLVSAPPDTDVAPDVGGPWTPRISEPGIWAFEFTPLS